MLSKNQLKYYSSLRQKKFRKQYKRFLAEGEKIVSEILHNPGSYFEIVSLIADEDFLADHDEIDPKIEVFTAEAEELNRISSLETANHALLELRIPDYPFDEKELKNSLSLLFEDIRDPGIWELSSGPPTGSA